MARASDATENFTLWTVYIWSPGSMVNMATSEHFNDHDLAKRSIELTHGKGLTEKNGIYTNDAGIVLAQIVSNDYTVHNRAHKIALPVVVVSNDDKGAPEAA